MSKRIIFISLSALIFSFASLQSAKAAISINCFTSKQAGFQENLCGTQFEITQAKIGDAVYIQGLLFSNSSNQVLFFASGSGGAGTILAEASASPIQSYAGGPISQLSFTIPGTHYNSFTKKTDQVLPGAYEIVVQTPEGNSGVKNFTIEATPSSVYSISPNEGNHLTQVDVSGSGFSDKPEENQIRAVMGSATHYLQPVIVNGNILRFNFSSSGLPLSTYSFGTYQIKTFVKGLEAQYSSGLNRNFTLRPHLNNLIPNSDSPDGEFSILGVFFGTDLSKIKIIFYSGATRKDEFSPNAIESGGSLLRGKVPNLPAGGYSVKVSVNSVESDNFFQFTVLPSALSVSLTAGTPSASGDVVLTAKVSGSSAAGEKRYFFSCFFNAQTTRINTQDNQSTHTCRYSEYGKFTAKVVVLKTAELTALAETEIVFSGPEVLAKPSLQNPGDGETLSMLGSDNLEWEAVDKASQYNWVIYDYDTGEKVASGFTENTKISIPLAGLEADTWYTWMVKAYDSKWNTSPWSQEWSFYSGQAPPLPGGQTPGPGPGTQGTPGPSGPGWGFTISNPLKAESFDQLVSGLLTFAFWLSLMAVPLMIIVAAFYYVTAGGDPSRINTANAIILYTFIGLGIILLARGLIAIIQTVLSG